MKKLLITGGSGFLGRELARQLRGTYDVVLASRNQEKNLEASRLTGCRFIPLDVSSLASVRDVFAEVRPEVVVHAAATKFVDISEKFPNECIDINVTGSQNIARCACDYGVASVIGVSTDKSAPPCRSTYGLSKALMERLFCSMDGKTQTRFSTVRFGNIAWSTGSVFPLWTKMLEQDGLIQTTGPHMRRFFFTVSNAARLVITGLENIQEFGGKVLSRQMKAAQVSDLLECFIQRYGGRFEQVAERPGESVDETLVGASELRFTQTVELNGCVHYLIDFNRPSERPLSSVVDSSNAERMGKEEMWELIELQREAPVGLLNTP